VPHRGGEDGVVISQSSTSTEESRLRVVIVYRTALLRDVLTQVLGESGITVVAAFPEAQLVAASLHESNPDVIVFDDVEANTFRTITQAILFSPSPLRAKKVIALGPGYLITLMYNKEVVHDASMEDLVARARFIPIRDDQEVVEAAAVP
jgi:DNA-binding NarL/FixJ family response regulator